ncbi:helix-turn-helix domain-containing protein [Maribellus mangrovi]|uniref:helix-turn-helix domain-containing protein n=1 Tax=Maribellus mangrovi TaxID=3133146 RepID=UPI0030EC970C
MARMLQDETTDFDKIDNKEIIRKAQRLFILERAKAWMEIKSLESEFKTNMVTIATIQSRNDELKSAITKRLDWIQNEAERIDNLMYENNLGEFSDGNPVESSSNSLHKHIVMPRYFKERRRKLNMSMQDVTDKTKISKATISRIERGGDAFFKTVMQLNKFYSDNGA